MCRNIYLPLLVLAVFLFPADNLAADTAAGKLTVVQGTVTVKKPGVEKTVAVGEGDSVLVGDVLQTGKDSRAQMVFTDDSLLNLSSDTALRVNQYIYDPEKNRRKAIVKLLGGKTRFVIYRERSADSAFYIATDKASVTAGIADFAVIALPEETDVVVFGGGASVKNIFSLAVGEVYIWTNQMTAVKKKMPPSRPSGITSKQRKDYIRDVSGF
ncbi:MAG: FecR domain-containing protein [Nitrospirae bacterium]|nr:FecR domain-containing protein [Nitrospirota bacterium]